ncbi:unnamed protein product [Linum tenue]|uniref:Uncharacterized protein n=1 Tax=Linum tenue TaxID=586396 RepID=A0AAV0PZ10_9ROSI|nr:unnamed protein product [Linum tenue]
MVTTLTSRHYLELNCCNQSFFLYYQKKPTTQQFQET